jgi:hypothetical protein
MKASHNLLLPGLFPVFRYQCTCHRIENASLECTILERVPNGVFGIINFIVDECIFFFKVGNRSPVSDSFWRKYIAKGSFSAFCGESSSRRENNLTIPEED